jgi:hypothetical protein
MDQGKFDSWLKKVHETKNVREAAHGAVMGVVAEMQTAVDEAKKLGATEAQVKPLQDVVIHYRDYAAVVADAVVAEPYGDRVVDKEKEKAGSS